MNSKVKNNTIDQSSCDKYASRMIRADKLRKSTTPNFQEKVSIVPKQQTATSPIQNRIRGLKTRQPSPIKSNNMTTILPPQQTQKDVDKDLNKCFRPRQRSTSSCSSHRESWGQLLQNNRSREHVSSFSNFDPLRTLHFLSKELHFKLQTVLPEKNDVKQIVYDIQHALKRIPPDVAALIHLQSNEFKPLKDIEDESMEQCNVVKPAVINKYCQTPPTLYQEDSESFHQIMEENTRKLAASCQQLEMVCTNLQQEKELTEKELENSQQTIIDLRNRVKELEAELEKFPPTKIQQLEEEKHKLQEKIQQLLSDFNENSTMTKMRQALTDLYAEKSQSEQARAKLEYDMALLTLENEKFSKILEVRDREIKEIQLEMSRIQDQVSSELKKLQGEVLSRVASAKSLTDNPSDGPVENHIGLGDATVSSIHSEPDTNGKDFSKESPCGDAEMATKLNSTPPEKPNDQIKTAKFDLPTSQNRDQTSLQELLKEINAVTNPFLLNKKS